MTVIDQIALKIIKEQELIIGPLAWQEAKKVTGLRIIDSRHDSVTIENGDNRLIIDKLVSQYERLFGRASREVSKEAATPLLKELASEQIPSSLK